MAFIWTIIIGLIAGIVAKLIVPGAQKEVGGFVLTALLGVAGALLATFLGQAVGWYQPGQNAGFIGAVVGSVIVLLIWGAITGSRKSPPMIHRQ
jgi:uncharacterized membrane protein YeaQ/YmgE (transglycosylase-associated protein family)